MRVTPSAAEGVEDLRLGVATQARRDLQVRTLPALRPLHDDGLLEGPRFSPPPKSALEEPCGRRAMHTKDEALPARHREFSDVQSAEGDAGRFAVQDGGVSRAIVGDYEFPLSPQLE